MCVSIKPGTRNAPRRSRTRAAGMLSNRAVIAAGQNAASGYRQRSILLGH